MDAIAVTLVGAQRSLQPDCVWCGYGCYVDCYLVTPFIYVDSGIRCLRVAGPRDVTAATDLQLRRSVWLRIAHAFTLLLPTLIVAGRCCWTFGRLLPRFIYYTR